MRKLYFKVSMFTNTWNKQSTVITIEEFFNLIRSNRWKAPVEAYRRCVSQQRARDAQTIKSAMACVVPAGTCRGGHAKKDLVSLSCLLCVDIDHSNERTKDILVRASLLQYVLGAFISISGNGLKLIIRADIETPDQYEAIYEATARMISTLLGVENDGQCKDITHLCYGSHDPEAYYNPQALPVNDFLPEGALDNVGRMSYSPAKTHDPGRADHEDEDATPDNRPPAKAKCRIPAASFAQSYLTLYPAVAGDRHGTAFRLSCEAWKRGINPEELAHELVKLMAEDTFREAEIRRTVKSAYQHKEQCPPTGPDFKTPRGANQIATNSQTALLAFSPDTEKAQKAERPHGEELRALTPTFPDEIFDWIPSIFKECTRMAKDKRERDGLLLSSVTTVSSMLPTVSCRYNRRKYGTNLYSIIIAPSGNSKGIFAYGLRLHKEYYAYWEKLNKEAEAAYEEECRKYEESQRQARRGNKPSATSSTGATADPRPPQEPKLRFPMIPSDISKAKFIQHLINNESCSSLLASTETSTLSSARGRDYGQFDDILCKAFEHESVSSSYKITGQRPLIVERPYLSTFFTGTPAGLLQFTPTTENGLFSRELPYTYAQPAVWQDVFAEEEESMDDLFDLLAHRFCRLALFLKDSPTIVTFTNKQKQMFNERFTELLSEVDLCGNDDLLSVVKRHGVMAVRLCMIFTAIDKATMGMNTPEIVCSDEHFKAALAIVTCCLEHSKLLVTTLKSSTEEVRPLQAPNRTQNFLDSLPEEFTTEQALRVGEEFEMNANVVSKTLNKATKKLKIIRISHGLYCKKA